MLVVTACEQNHKDMFFLYLDTQGLNKEIVFLIINLVMLIAKDWTLNTTYSWG